MASYDPAPAGFGEERGFGRAASQDDSEVSMKLANALRKMDGLIGDYRYVRTCAPLFNPVPASHLQQARRVPQ